MLYVYKEHRIKFILIHINKLNCKQLILYIKQHYLNLIIMFIAFKLFPIPRTIAYIT